jgi:anti-sigma regulatory factor (Ser/Thr protein kinase)
MSTVHLAFSPDAAYVRTVRLVAAAAARHAGVSDKLLDEVRIAIGEACTRAVAMHRRHGMPDLIDVAMSDGGRFTVSVTDRGPFESALKEPGETTKRIMAEVAFETGRFVVDEDAVTADVGLALIRALGANLTVGPAANGPGTEITMWWPASRRSS